MHNKYSQFKDILKKYNQEHILNYLNEENKEELINQILNIDFEEILELYEETKKPIEIDIENIESANAINPQKIDKEKIYQYRKIGSNTIKNGQFAVSIMAGGQGTRLRTRRTKGKF